ncbi:MAG: glutamate-1-semialdehyde-2,1-aminomutase [Legionellales bacterium RIFCSPHIGHO2_12_FULL_35_11]|nr:MAG: glutamate-1-semialdehyde-2,1-aminomutase [Legionellales bacterium RIFCSPHIGHO2_12_FULL_35_11]
MKNSENLFIKAKKIIPGGVNSPVRAFKGVGGNPVFLKKGEGAYLIDVDENRYLDYVGSWGPLILGHCHPKVSAAVKIALENGVSFGAPTEVEIQLAEKIISIVPAIQKVRMVNSGTEATMTAIRLARGFTGKFKIIKFNGCYHGHSDALLVKAGSGLLTLGIPSSSGILSGATEHTLTADYNDFEQVENIFRSSPDEIAAIIIEPIAGNMGLIKPSPGFLEGLRELCDNYKSLLIFDEVMTGFRVALGGAEEVYNVRPDLVTLGKIIGGGLPVGAVGGRTQIMDMLAPEGNVYQAGTLSGNPLAMSAGLACLSELERPGFYNELSQKSSLLIKSLAEVCLELNIPFCGSYVGGMFGFCFNNLVELRNLEDISTSDEDLFRKFYHAMLKEGVYFAPSMFEAGFMSCMHSIEDIEFTKHAARKVLGKILVGIKN